MRKNLPLLVFAFCVFVNNLYAQKLELSTKTINACSPTTVQVCATTYQPYVITSAQQDDFFTGVVELGFNFNYFGQQFSAIVISPNNMVSFDLALADLYSEWEYGSALNTGQLNKAIMFPFQDLHIGGAIRYKTVGAAPNRKFVIEFCQVPFYFCLSNTTTNQLILHETSNIIEMHIASKPYCAGWSGSPYASAIQGIKSGTNEVFVAGRGPNAGPWAVSAPEALRFSPNGIASYAVSNIAYDPVTLIEPGNGNFQWFAGNSTTPFATTPCAGITTDQNTDYYVVKYTGSNIACNPAANNAITDTVYVNHDEVVATTTLTFCRDQLPAQWRGITIPNTANTINNYDSVWVNGTNGSCDTNYILNLIVNDYQPAQFTPVGTICAGTAFSLPGTSNNGITGIWSPAVNNTATTTYTFTPDQGQCGLAVNMTVTVQPSDTPFFNQVGSICAGATLAPLPTTSLNGITGSWSPALNNNSTTTYTFTPDNTGTCIISPTMTIVVTPVDIPVFDQVMPICSGGPLGPLPTTSLNGYTGTWSPSINSSVTTTYTFTPDPGQGCVSSTTMTINVNDTNSTPAFVNPGAYCEGYQFTLPNISLNGIAGTWSPAYDYHNTTTYTFTPDPGQCGDTLSMTITIVPYVVPEFTQVPPVCSGGTINALPTTSNNGIPGSWSPALNNTQTTTYTFTPSTAYCANAVTMTIVVDSGTVPSFTIVDSVCEGTTVSPLPATSQNGITGTWSPAFNSSTPTTYTFTPSSQCAPAVTHTLGIMERTAPDFTQIIPICQGESLSPFPTTSLNGISGTWSPAPNNMATTTYTFTPDPGFCATTATMTVIINSNGTLPVFDSLPNMCVGTAITPLPTTSLNGITGTWSPALNNTQTTTYTFTPVANSCGIPTNLTIIIDTLMVPAFNPVGPICYGAPLNPLPLISNNGLKGTWSPALNNTQTTTYTFTPILGQCAVPSTTMTIVVDTAIVPFFAAVPAICAGDALTPLPAISQNGITGNWSPALNNTATTTYTFTPDPGQCAATDTMTIVVNPVVTPLFTQVSAICAGEPLTPLPDTSNNGITGTWSPAWNNTQTTTYTFTPAAGQCATTATMTINVNDGTLPVFTQVSSICAGGTLNPLPTTSSNNITGSWSPALNNTATTTYTFTPAPGQCALTATMTIGVDTNVIPVFAQVASICSGGTLNPLPLSSLNGISGTWSPALNNTQTTTYTFTPAAGQCATTTGMTITVDTAVVPVFAAVPAICEGAALNPLPGTSQNGISGTWSPAVNNTATTTYTFTPAAGQCAATTTLTITVNPNTVPQFTQVNAICAGATLNPLPTTSLNGVTGTWSPALNNTATTTYTFTPAAGQCATTATMTINVNNGTVPTFTQVSPVCAGGILNPLPATSNNNITGTWSPAPDNTITTTYTFTPNAGQCALTTTMTIVVTPNVTPAFAPVAPICTGGTLNPLPLISQNGINGTWSPALNNTQTTTYTFTPAAGQCATTASMTIIVDTAVVPVFTPVAAICQGGSLNPLPATSLNGINGTWSPALNNTATTTYTFTPAAGQCAATTTLTINVTPNTVAQFTQVAPICTGATLAPLPTTSLNGVTGTWSPALNNTATTTYTFTPTAGTGSCWTGTTMQIVVDPYLTGNRNVSICAGNSYTFNGTTYTSSISGVTDTISNLNSCDSIITLYLTVNPVTTGIQQATICAGDTYTFNGQAYSASNNTAKDTLVNQYGCDSIVTLNLTVLPVNPVTDTVRLTDCGSVIYAGNTYTVNTHLVDTIHNGNGCDSIYKHILIEVNPVYTFKETVHIKGCKEVTYKGITYDASTVFEEEIKTAKGCDSLVNTVVIEINDFKLKAFMNPEAPFKGEQVQIQTYSVGNVPYAIVSWEPAILFPNQTATEQRVQLDNPVRIVVTGVHGGCEDTALIDITEFPGYSNEVKVPSAFSPNGDGLNDVFAPVLRIDHGYSLVSFKVFSRYGELVHSTSNMNSGWDGTYKGRLQDAGVYYYMIKIKFLDGTEKFFKGDITLLK